jgi:hypothetical protein
MESYCLVNIINYINIKNNFNNFWGIFTFSIHNYVHCLHMLQHHIIKSKSVIFLIIYFMFLLTIICKNIVKLCFNNDLVEIFKWAPLKNSNMCNIIDPLARPPIVCFYLRFLLNLNLPWNIKIVLNII